MFGFIKSNLVKIGAAVGSLFCASIVSAASVLPADVATTFADTKADIVTIIGLAMTLVLAIVAWRYIRRAAS